MAHWWVNQGKTYKQERAAGILWAPKTGAGGSTRAYWRSMTDLAPNDTVFHYARGIRAVSRVRRSAYDAERPPELPTDAWQRDGWAADVDYFELDDPVALEEVPREERLNRKESPFQLDGGVKLGYLFPLSEEFGDMMLTLFAERLPAALAAAAGPTPDEGAHGAARLLRRLLGEPLETLTGRPNRILEIRDGNAVVATDRSPEGTPVPITDVDRALSELDRSGSIIITPEAVGYRSAFVGAVLRTLPGATVALNPPRVLLTPLPADDQPAPGFDGELDRPAIGTNRREQAGLRRWLLAGRTRATCALCGRAFPADMLVAAHVKPRSLCDNDERRDFRNIAMLVCKFGCDDLFEAGYLAVGRDGTIRATRRRGVETVGAVDDMLDSLAGRACTAHSAASERYFKWHRRNRFLN